MGLGRKIRRKHQNPFARENLRAGIQQVSREATHSLRKGLATAVDGGRRRLTVLVDEASRLDPPACKQGCSWCCRGMKVSTSPWEVLALARWLKVNWSEEALVALGETMQRYDGLDAEAYAKAQLPCPLLDDVSGSCKAYPARPWACMAHLASDAGSCKEAFEVSDAGIAKNLFGTLALGLVHTGFVETVDTMKLTHYNVDLIEGLRIALTPDAEKRWLAGDDVFAAARSAEEDEDLQGDVADSLNALLDG